MTTKKAYRSDMQTIIGIDPGPRQSAYVSLRGKQVGALGILPNGRLLTELMSGQGNTICVIEKIESFGMPVGRSVFDTVFFTGQLDYALARRGIARAYLTRREVKLHLCNSMKAKDKNIRQSVLDRFPAIGGGACPQVGTKNSPGPLYGVKSHVWSALALAVTFLEKQQIDQKINQMSVHQNRRQSHGYHKKS